MDESTDTKDAPMADVKRSHSNVVGHVVDDSDYGADSELRRLLSTRHLTMIALGSSIGMGLWLGSGTSLTNGGPAAIFLGYLLSGSMIWAVSHSIGEMAVMYPIPSAFVQWTGKFVDPAAAFALGWAYWFSYCITIANELQVSASPMMLRGEGLLMTSLVGCCHRLEFLDRCGADCGMDHHLLGRHRGHQCRRRLHIWRGRGRGFGHQVRLDLRRHHLHDRYTTFPSPHPMQP